MMLLELHELLEVEAREDSVRFFSIIILSLI
jgi:hypothetical protein